MLRVRDLISKENCGYRGILNSYSLKNTANKYYYISILLKKVWNEVPFPFDRKELENFLKANLSPDIYITKKEFEEDLNTLTDELMRYSEFECLYNRTIVNKSQKVVLDIHGQKVKVYIDLAFEGDNGKIEVIKVKRKVPEMTKRGRKKDTDPSQSIELYLLQKAGESLFNGKEVYPTIVYLRNKNDKPEDLAEFEEKECQNLISFTFKPMDMKTINVEKRIKDIISSKNTDKCPNSNCDTCEYKNLCTYTHVDNSTLKVVPPQVKAVSVTFTREQMKAIRFKRGYSRVNAVAGSGKTTVIDNRVVEMIKTGLIPIDFLIITFTEKGVREICEKLDFWLKAEKLPYTSKNFTIQTFNGFGYELIKKEFASLGFTKEPAILDKLEKMDIIRDILDNIPKIEGLNYRNPIMDFFRAKGALVEVSEIIDEIKSNNIIYPEELQLLKDYSLKKAQDLMLVYLEFQKRLKTLGYVQYQDQINYAIEILENPNNVQKYGFRHIIVDEFQDTDVNQLYIVQKLTGYSEFTSLSIYGDDAQSIFAFRGTTPENILNFHKIFPNVEDIVLSDNFRSTKEICYVADFINRKNNSFINKKIVSKKSGKMPELVSGGVDKAISIIKDKIAEGVPLHEIGVIARTKAELLEVEKALKLENISCLLAISEMLKDNDKVKNIIGYAKFLMNNKLDLHFAEYLQVTKNEEFAISKNLGDFIAIEKAKLLAHLNACNNDYEQIEFFFKSLENVRAQDRAVDRLLNIIKNKQFATLSAICNYLILFEKYNSEISIEKDENTYDAITLTTAHASKGREFKVVLAFIDKFKYDVKEREEERRLLYVTLTRAKEEEYILFAKNTENGFYHEIDKAISSI